MNSLNEHETERLRATDLMVAYLRDEASLEDVVQIETLMENDPLYRMSIESLADSLIENPFRARQHDLHMQAAFPDLLTRAKEDFVRQLETPDTPQSGSKGFPKGLGYAFAGILILALAWIWWPSTPGTVELHTAPLSHLSPAKDIQMVEKFVAGCGDYDPGIGSGQTSQLTVSSIMVDHFAIEQYDFAAQQLSQVKNQGTLSPACELSTEFYLGECHMAMKHFAKATAAFTTVANAAEAPQALQHASHWYLANIALEQQAYEVAAQHLSQLVKADPSPENHVGTLLTVNYLETAKRYLDDIEGR